MRLAVLDCEINDENITEDEDNASELIMEALVNSPNISVQAMLLWAYRAYYLDRFDSNDIADLAQMKAQMTFDEIAQYAALHLLEAAANASYGLVVVADKDHSSWHFQEVNEIENLVPMFSTDVIEQAYDEHIDNAVEYTEDFGEVLLGEEHVVIIRPTIHKPEDATIN